MIAKVFVDTNVLVYCRDNSEPEKQGRAQVWMAHLWQTRQGRLSFQVLQEFYVTVTAKLKPGMAADAARRDVAALLAWRPRTMDGRLMDAAWQIQDRYQLSFWDALIAAAAQAEGCRWLLSEDFQAGLKLGEVQVVKPFEALPEEIGMRGLI